MGIGTLRRRHRRVAQADTSPAVDTAGEAPQGEPQEGQEQPEEPEVGQEPADAPEDAERPAGNASRDEWAAYAATTGLEQELIDGASRAELQELTAADG